ncbi:MAG: hypothetical protein RBT66_07785 [bacterium]|jgi:hypothetical protein|nr:hypothetical protein [bacterium]
MEQTGGAKNGATRLKGINAISDYYDRPWNVIVRLIERDGFPACKIGGRWESDTRSIDEWHRMHIERAMISGA